MKKYKRIIIAILIIVMILIPINISNATTLTPDSTETTLNEIVHNGVTIKTNEIIQEATYGLVNVTIEGTNLVENLAGCTGTICFNGGHTPCYIESLSENWSIQSQRIKDNFISFIVEKNDFANTENSVTLEIKYKIDWTSFSKDTWAVGTGNISEYTEFVIADSQNNCYSPFADLEENHIIQVALKESSKRAVEVKIEKGNIAKIDNTNKKIYIKLNGTQNGFATYGDFFDCLNFNVELNDCEIAYGENSYTNIPDEDPDNVIIETIDKIKFNTEEGSFEYEVCQLGDVWFDEVNSGSIINVNDVIALRKAVIGDTETLNSPYFKIENTDVNFSNSELGTLGDVGDIISLRKRILNNEWKDIFEYGDVNLDGEVNVLDCNMILRYLNNEIELNTKQLEVADVNLDNVVDSTDIDIIQQYITRTIDTLPYLDE